MFIFIEIYLGPVESCGVMTSRKPHFLRIQNSNGGWYQRGKVFIMPKKLDIGYQYLDMCIDKWPEQPSRPTATRDESQNQWSLCQEIIMELENTGSLTDPEVINSEAMRDRETIYYLDPVEELFLLALCAEKPARSNREYIVHLYTYYGTVVSSTFITEWFKTRFDHKGSFRKPNIVPLDKFWAENVIRFIESKLKCQLLFDHSRFCFIDEKHLVNSDSVPKKTTLLSNLEKNGLHCSKQRFPRYVQSHGLHQWKSFEGEVCSCAYNGQRKWHSCCLYDEIIVMDNAAIHTGGASAHLERFLGEKVVDGRPLHILVVYLPT